MSVPDLLNPRVVAHTVIKGLFPLPLGLHLYRRDDPESVEVSTVFLEGGHLEDPLGICDKEHGYESMVFLDGCSFFSLFTEQYDSRQEAVEGHKRIVDRLMARELPLTIQILHYVTRA